MEPYKAKDVIPIVAKMNSYPKDTEIEKDLVIREMVQMADDDQKHIADSGKDEEARRERPTDRTYAPEVMGTTVKSPAPYLSPDQKDLVSVTSRQTKQRGASLTDNTKDVFSTAEEHETVDHISCLPLVKGGAKNSPEVLNFYNDLIDNATLVHVSVDRMIDKLNKLQKEGTP